MTGYLKQNSDEFNAAKFLSASLDRVSTGEIDSPLPGSNDSSSDTFLQADGSSNWWDMKLEYSLPFGATENKGAVDYKLAGGLLVSEPSGGVVWNPLTSGASVVVLR